MAHDVEKYSSYLGTNSTNKYKYERQQNSNSLHHQQQEILLFNEYTLF